MPQNDLLLSFLFCGFMFSVKCMGSADRFPVINGLFVFSLFSVFLRRPEMKNILYECARKSDCAVRFTGAVCMTLVRTKEIAYFLLESSKSFGQRSFTPYSHITNLKCIYSLVYLSFLTHPSFI